MSFVIIFFLCIVLLIENISGLSSSQLSSEFVTQHHIFLLAWRAQAQLWRKLLTNHQPHKVHQTTDSCATDPLNQIRLIWSFTASSPSHEVLFLGKLLFVHSAITHIFASNCHRFHCSLEIFVLSIQNTNFECHIGLQSLVRDLLTNSLGAELTQNSSCYIRQRFVHYLNVSLILHLSSHSGFFLLLLS